MSEETRQLLIDAIDGSAAHLETSHDAQDTDDEWILDLYATVQRALAAVRGLDGPS